MVKCMSVLAKTDAPLGRVQIRFCCVLLAARIMR